MIPAPGGVFELDDGRRLAYDDVGDPAGRPIVHLHGLGDSRLSRHPNDEIAAELGVRLISVDRPGYGGSTSHAAGSFSTLATDIEELANRLDLQRLAVLGRSAAGPGALACGARLGSRVVAVGVACGLAPPSSAADPVVAAVLPDALREGWAVASAMSPEQFGAMVAPFAVPVGVDLELAREHTRDGADAVTRAEFDRTPAFLDQLAFSLVVAIEQGVDGVARDLALGASELDFDLAAIAAPVLLWYGTADHIAPPAFGRWYADRVPNAHLVVVEGAPHLLPLMHWSQLLDSLARQFDTEESTCR